MRTDVDVLSHGTRLSVWHYPAGTDDLVRDGRRPCVVMAHGFGCTRDMGLEPFAERFVAAGADVLLFDYRGFGDSDGDERQVVDHARHRDDYRAVLAHARRLDGVDPDRAVLWGSSYSGGHVVAVAADDGRVGGVISQGAAMDGRAATLEIVRYAGLRQLLRLSAVALVDQVRHLLRRPSRSVALVGPPGALAAITAPDAQDGYGAIATPTFRNDMPARCILRIALNRPVTSARRLRAPLLLVMATRDSIAPPAAVERVARLAQGPVDLLRLEVGHFDIYLGEPFETSVARQVALLRQV